MVDFIFDNYVLERLGIILGILILFRIVIALFNRFLARAEAKGLDKAAVPLISSLVKYALYIIAFVIVLNILGVNTTGIVAAIGAASLAIGLALKDTLSNIASGLLLLFLRPFKAGDYIECGSIKGKISGIGLFNTTFQSLDGLFVSAPNSALWGAPIVNFSKNPTRRIEITVGISYSSSINRAIEVLRELVDNEPKFLKNPEPQYYVANLSESSVDITFRVWVNNDDYFATRQQYVGFVKERFDAAGIEIPFPQCVVHMQEK